MKFTDNLHATPLISVEIAGKIAPMPKKENDMR